MFFKNLSNRFRVVLYRNLINQGILFIEFTQFALSNFIYDVFRFSLRDGLLSSLFVTLYL